MNKQCTFIFSLVLLCCSDNKNTNPGNKDTKKEYHNPSGYDLNKPEKFDMPDALKEISGIAFYKGNKDTIYAEQDEEGKLYYLHLGDAKASHVKFGKKGDYEDLVILNDQVIMLRSDGTLFSFPFSEVKKEEITSVKEWDGLLPADEFEGIYGSSADNKLYVLCKHCGSEKTSQAITAFILQIQPDGNIVQSGSVNINVRPIDSLAGEKKIKFNPSALSKNPRTQEWYILSSVNKMLVVADNSWNAKEVYRLDPALFRQPEGIAFDSENNMYISNEGDDISRGNVLKFVYKKE
jgi:hypothetical protein